MKVIGLTGPTGAGKTTVLQVLEKHGAVILDCDAVYYEMLRESHELKAALKEAFGEVFLASGELDRRKLGVLVFDDPAQMRRLDAIVYYYMGLEVRRRLQEAKAAGAKMVAVDAINFIDSGLGELCDVKAAVLAPEEVRLGRIMARDGISEDYARSRIKAQQTEEYFRRHCPVILENHGSPEDLVRKTEEILLGGITHG